MVEFKDNDGNILKRPFVWADAKDIVDEIWSSLYESYGDGGQGILKMCITILPDGYEPQIHRTKSIIELEDDSDSEIEAHSLPKRSTYASGGTV